MASNSYGGQVDPLYVATPHPLAHGSPSAWDARRDPFHTTGAAAELTPTRFDIGQQLALADDFDEAARLRAKTGHEGSWGDRLSFLRSHHLVQDTYRHKAKAARRELYEGLPNNGE